MPVLTIRLAGEATLPDGSKQPIPPAQALLQRGPVVQVSISVSSQFATQIAAAGGTLPNPVSGLGLIDTGAGSTCIDEQAAQQLGIPAIDVVSMASASHAASQRNVYPIRIEIQPSGINIEAARAIGAELAAQGLILLIGRDVLAHCMLVCNGIDGSFSISV